tara:strand:+ start:1083 stop:2126 length:1044 start_codon:yes stop_codon:yes gene_type:complete
MKTTMKTTMKNLSLLFLIVALISSCQKDNSSPIPTGVYDNGYFVINQGNFGSGNGSISFISEEDSVINDIYFQANGVQLGDVVQSMEIIGDYAYIIVNNSDKIIIASKYNMEYVTEISVSQPRYIKQVSSDKAYITSWGTNSIHVVNLNSGAVINEILCGIGPESITIHEGLAYITNVGGWGIDSIITVIDIASDVVAEIAINAGDKPNSAQIDANGDLWVLCGGVTWPAESATLGKLVKISNNIVINSFTFSLGQGPKNLVINDSGTMLYYLSGGSVYSFDINDTSLPTLPLILESFYAIGFNNGYIHGVDAIDWVQSGYSKKYSVDGVLQDTYSVGIIPGGYCFN